jgi:hypothetical protein
MIPTNISPTTMGNRKRLKRDNRTGTRKARKTTSSKGINDLVSSMEILQAKVYHTKGKNEFLKNTRLKHIALGIH